MSKVKTLVHRQRIIIAAVVFILALATAAFGCYRYMSWTDPLNDDNYSQAAESIVGNKAVALFDRGLTEYRQSLAEQDQTAAAAQWTNAQNSLVAAYNQLLQNGNGTAPDSLKKLAADIQFQLGNMQVVTGLAQQSLELIQSGVQSYEECLRLDPNNLAAKYNIELLEQSDKVNKKDNPGGPGKPGNKPGQPGPQVGGAGHNHGDGT